MRNTRPEPCTISKGRPTSSWTTRLKPRCSHLKGKYSLSHGVCYWPRCSWRWCAEKPRFENVTLLTKFILNCCCIVLWRQLPKSTTIHNKFPKRKFPRGSFVYQKFSGSVNAADNTWEEEILGLCWKERTLQIRERTAVHPGESYRSLRFFQSFESSIVSVRRFLLSFREFIVDRRRFRQLSP